MPKPRRARPKPLPSIPAEAALSFLKDTKGMLTWSVRDLADALGITQRDAEQVIPLLQAQGYVQPQHGTHQWMTTPSGETISGTKPPRFTRQSVEQALTALKQRIKEINKDPKAEFKITNAVAFGDFLTGRTRVQPADVGVSLKRRNTPATELHSASDAQAERAFLKHLRGRSALLHLRPHVEWMSQRSHRNLL
jgi:DNA-binding transcriptional MocR family regulator